MHESKLDYREWSSLTQWASISQSREARSMTATGEFAQQRLKHRVRLPDTDALDKFLEDPRVKRLNLAVVSNEQLAETLDDRRLTLEGVVEASALELTKLAASLIRAAFIVDGRYEGYQDAKPDDTGEPATSIKTNLVQQRAMGSEAAEVAADPKRQLKLRAEFLGDVMGLRHMLAPFALDWRDVEPPVFMVGAANLVKGWDRDVELSLADGAPGLDDLRWYLNQATDMHVAAESLHYAHRYTGERLPHDLVEDMLPSLDVRRGMAERLGKICGAVEAMLERLECAHSTIAATLPKAKASGARRMG